MNHSCPYCGAALPEGASFCPHCAQSINNRTESKVPRYIWGKVLRIGIPLLLVCFVAFGYWFVNRPQTYEGNGEVYYTDDDGVAYQLLIAYNSDRHTPVPEISGELEENGEYRTAIRMFVNYVNSDDDAEAGKAFMQKVEQVTMECVRVENSDGPLSASEPAWADHSPDATLVTLVDFTGRVGVADICWNIQMKNGDTVILRQRMNTTSIEAYDYYPEDHDMDSAEALQTLIDEIAQTVNPEAIVRIHLPAVTYTEGLVIEERPVSLVGNTEGDGRTVFTDTVRVAATDMSYTPEFRDIDFTGNSKGIGVSSSSAHLHLIGCNFSNWNTGVLAYGSAWVNLDECTLENNHVGFHFNSPNERGVSDTTYSENEFANNDTAVLLEHVPTDATLSFTGSVFSKNGADIDNRCDQPVNIDAAIFE